MANVTDAPGKTTAAVQSGTVGTRGRKTMPRLIDADYVQVKLARMAMEENYNLPYLEVEEVVRLAPTIDPESLRPHGEWVVCGDGDNVPWMCSHCGKTTAHKYKVMYGKYCPNCGAKMDEEE